MQGLRNAPNGMKNEPDTWWRIALLALTFFNWDSAARGFPLSVQSMRKWVVVRGHLSLRSPRFYLLVVSFKVRIHCHTP